jgi:hypothetical protein
MSITTTTTTTTTTTKSTNTPLFDRSTKKAKNATEAMRSRIAKLLCLD